MTIGHRARPGGGASELGEIGAVDIDSHYTGWGGKVSIKAPAPGTVTETLR